MDSVALKPGALAPQFSLPLADGTLITRSQYRNKSGLALIFVPSVSDPAASAIIEAVAKDADAYRKLNAKVYVIAREPGEATIPVLHDATGEVWRVYSGLDRPGYGVFVLDRYGGVDSQIATTDAGTLPDADTIREWVQSAMYRCNI